MLKTKLNPGLFLGASLVTLIAAGLPASADDLRVTSKISSVTVYPTGAMVVRTVPVTLPAGSSVVVLDDLPAELEADSLKVEGAADRAIAIASVEAREIPADDAADPQRVAIADEIQVIDDKLAAIADRMGALDGRKRFLEKLIDSVPGGFGKSLGEGTGNIDQWGAAATTIGDGLAQVAEAVRAGEIEKRGLDRQRDEREKALAALPAPRDHESIRIALAADAAATGTLTVSYRSPSARWLPTYDAQLTTGDGGAAPALSIIRRAEVTQSTGEDWNGVALTLSTAQALGGTEAPDLQPHLVSFYSPDTDAIESETKPTAAPAPLAAGGMLDAPGDKAAQSARAKIVEAAADFGDFRAEYKVPGLVSVDSGEGARSLQIATDAATPKLAVRSVPMVSETAYLQASFVPPSGAPLLAGKIALFRDGVFVGNGEIPFTNAGKELDLGFGVDDRVHVKRVVLDHQTGEHGILSSRKTDSRAYKITVDNLHTRPMDITVLDRIPYAESEDIAVERLDGTTEPTVTNVDDKRGVLAWTYTYAPGESRDIENAYEVSWPASQSVVSLD